MRRPPSLTAKAPPKWLQSAVNGALDAVWDGFCFECGAGVCVTLYEGPGAGAEVRPAVTGCVKCGVVLFDWPSSGPLVPLRWFG